MENTPIDFFTAGDAAVQSYACDTFSLGLCLVHLLTGRAPYEEILAQVQCPPSLMTELKKIWNKKPAKNAKFTYTIIKETLADDPDDVLCHTFYRYLVLFGLPDVFPKGNPVWQLIEKYLGPPISRNQRSREVSSCRARFQDNVDEFSFLMGTHEALVRARDNCSERPGLCEVVMAMVSYDPSERPTMKAILQSTVFDSIRTASEHVVQETEYRFMDYARDELKNL